MARAGYANVVADSFGNRVAGAAVEVRQPGTATPLAGPLYQALTGAATLANPLTTDRRMAPEIQVASWSLKNAHTAG